MEKHGSSVATTGFLLCAEPFPSAKQKPLFCSSETLARLIDQGPFQERKGEGELGATPHRLRYYCLWHPYATNDRSYFLER
jgi:hypothetical protein